MSPWYDLGQETTDSTSIGWDPVFEYEGQTYAEMDKAEKVCFGLPAECLAPSALLSHFACDRVSGSRIVGGWLAGCHLRRPVHCFASLLVDFCFL
jgi:hypothetical protein